MCGICSLTARRSACYNNQVCPRLRHPGLFDLEVSRTVRCLEMGSLITLPGHGHRMGARLHRCRHPGTLSRCPLTPLRPPSRERAPSLVLRDDRSVFGVVCREVCYLPVIHQLAGLGGPEQMLGTEHRLWLTRGTLYNTALICRDDPEVLQGFSVTHRKQAQIDGRL